MDWATNRFVISDSLDTSPNLHVYISPTNGWINTGIELPTGKKSHCVFTTDGSTFKIYIGGELLYTSSALTVSAITGASTLGVYVTDHSSVTDYKGSIRQFMVFSREINQEEVTLLNNMRPAIL